MLSRQRQAALVFLLVAISIVISAQFLLSIRSLRSPDTKGRLIVPPKGQSGYAVSTTQESPRQVRQDCEDDICLEGISKVWKKHPWQSWCSTPGLVLVKVPKSASSTLAGVILRIQHRHNCTVHWKHKLAREFSWKKNEIRVAPIRDPTSRALSSLFFHHVSFHGKRHSPTDEFVIQHLKASQHNYIVDYTAPSSDAVLKLLPNITTARHRKAELVHVVQEVVRFYHFLFVVDRLDESLVVWSWLTDLPFADLMTVGSSKQAGSWYSSGGKRCFALAKPVKTPAVQAFTESTAWKRNHAADRLLYRVARASLDRTIDEVMGRSRFEQDLQQFRKLKEQVQKACLNETFFPCSSTGVSQLEKSKQSCYVRDFGCGYPCLDRFVEQNMQS